MPVHTSLEIATLPLNILLSNAAVLQLVLERHELLAARATLASTNASLTSELTELRQKVKVMESIRLLHPEQDFPYPPTNTLTKSPSESSVSPSDSASQRGCEGSHPEAPAGPYLVERPSERPSDFSPEVPWTLQDCRRDPTAHKGNRINLSAVIRNKDGSIVNYLKVIKTTARIHFLSSLAHLSIPPDAPKHQTGLWWKNYRPNEWRAALQHLEVTHPVVAYCASHWKAEEIFRVVIQTRLDSERAKKQSKRQQERVEEGISADPTNDTMATKPQSLKRPYSAICDSTDDPNASLEKPLVSPAPPVPTPAGLSQNHVQSLEIDEPKELVGVEDILVPESAVKPEKDDLFDCVRRAMVDGCIHEADF